MFKRASEQELLKRNIKIIGSGSLNKLRILESIPLRKLNDSQSNHSSVMTSSVHSSIKNAASSNGSILGSEFSYRSSIMSKSKDKKAEQTPEKKIFTRQQSIQNLLQKHFGRAFTKSLVQFLNKDWENVERQFLAEKKLQNFVQTVIQRGNWLKDLIDEFLEKEYQLFSNQDRRMMISVIFRECVTSLRDYEGIIPDIIRKIPEERVLKQQTVIEDLSNKLLQIYNPTYSYSNSKVKERMHLYHQEYVLKKNDLKSDICNKLKSNLEFLEKVQHFFAIYQKEMLKLKSQLSTAESEKTKYQEMLARKSNFAPLQVDYDKLYEMRDRAQQEIKNDLEINIIQFHEQKHKRNELYIHKLEGDIAKAKEDNEKYIEEIARLKESILDWKKNIPERVEAGVQVYLINQGRGSENAKGSLGWPNQFLENVVTPFSFSKDITSSLLSVISIDKILYDYQLIRQRHALRSFEEFVFQWFIIRTGCKKIAQIFVKNFQYSLKQLRVVHKRFWIFQKICGWSGFKRRNMQEDLQSVFFSSHLCWYYLMKLALMYRRRLNENPTGYHLFPPLLCQEIFKLPLRKIYELIEQFLKNQEIEVPSDLTQRIDHYCINEISKFRSNSQEFQKETLEEIHILREINFDLITGFVLQYIANLKCTVVQKLLRTIENKQKQEGSVLGFSEFEAVYRKFYRERRSKIEQVYAKLCMTNQHDMLDIQNMQAVVSAIIEDESPLRNAFDKLEPLKVLILSEKVNIMRGDKKVQNPNSYQNFRQRYYHQFYDFYSTTGFLDEIFKIVKTLIKKNLKSTVNSESQVDQLLTRKEELTVQTKEKNNSSECQEDDNQLQENQPQKQSKTNYAKESLAGRLEQWGKVMTKVPHFTANVLTIDQIIIHNMRRKQMIEATEFAWKTMREILCILGKR